MAQELRTVSRDALLRANACSADVYLSGSLVEYRGSADVKKGRNVLEIAGVSANADPSRIQMRFSSGISSCHILGVEKVLLREGSAALELRKKIRRVMESLSALELQFNAWKKTAEFSAEVPFETTTAAIEALPGRLMENREKVHEYEEKLDELQKELEKLEKENAAGLKTVSVLRAEVHAEEDGPCPFSILAEDEAHWTPFYEILVENTSSPLRTRLRASIFRNGDLDWDGVALRLIYGDKNREGTRPVLSVWRLDLADNATRSFPRPMMSARAAACEDTAMLGGEPAPGANFFVPPAPKTRVSTEVLSQYSLPGTYHVERSGETVLDVLEQTIPADYLYSAVPKLDPDVFLTATVAHPEKYSLLPCEAFVTYDHLSIGTVHIPMEASGVPFILSLGRDQGVLTTRKKTLDEHSEGVLSGRQSRSYSYNISVTNRKDTDIRLEIHDQIPISADEKIRVSAQELSGGSLKDTTGEIIWKFNPLKKGETANLKLSFSITYPKNARLL